MPSPSVCTVSGTLYGPGGSAQMGVVVKAYITTGFTDGSGNHFPAGILASTTSAADGTWSLAVLQTQGLGHSVTFQFEYPLGNNQSRSVKYAAVIPAQATANFADIVNLGPGTAVLAFAPTTDSLPEGTTNLYFTTTRARAALSATSPVVYSSSTGVVSLPVATTSVDGYLSHTDWNTFNGKQAAITTGATSKYLRGDLSLATLDTSVVPENTNLYYTDVRADARIALQRGASSGLASLDSGGKVPLGQLPASLMEYQGTWNASTNTPTLADGTGTSGYFYRVNTAGTQNLGSGSQTFVVGDWVMYNGAIWQLAHAGADAVISVAGKAGVVTLVAADVSGVLTAANNLSDVSTPATAFNNISGFTLLGDTHYGGSSGVRSVLAGNTTSTKKFLRQTGTGTVSAAPAWDTLVGSDLPNPSASTLGGVQSAAAVSHQWINSISTSGVPALSQPAFSDISGSVAAAQLPNPSASTLGGIESYAAVTNQWINAISTSGVPSSAQPAFSNISGSVAASQLPNPSASTLGGVESIAAVSHNFLTSISTSGVPAQAQPAFTDISGTATVAQTTVSTQAISSTAIDWSTGAAFTKTLGASTTFTFTGQVSGQTIIVRLTNTASNWTVTWPTVKWSGGAAPTMTTGAKDDIYTFFYDGTTYYGSAVQNCS